MTVTAKIIADSIGWHPVHKRVTTLLLRYPRFIHAEFMTHRVFSRNASSSRAIPVKTLIRDIRKDPAMPLHWGANQKGMQAHKELQGWKRKAAKGLWLGGMWVMTSIALLADKLGAHKQIVNRLVEPWSHINVLVTSTSWANFFALRDHPDAQPEIRALAIEMKAAMDKSVPQVLKFGQWHLPFVLTHTEEDGSQSYQVESDDGVWWGISLDEARKASVARSARTSYRLHDGSFPSLHKDLQLCDQLVGSEPLHASPAEHQCTPDYPFRSVSHPGEINEWAKPELHGNLEGYIQLRKTLPNEYVKD